ncbi:class I SAM-dependent methyltransferase [Bacillus horti]|uniref:Ubiquinone/menaquinone biosynthesis C-methylase UbiE n=1 Tax=Caldalkalibacillus horti TaxID=77523 RepID=A0ABT9VWT6_9BACI|nr:class I SAM-dependent methyltransferase [Bacillus horti]MDQ0165459.1 ubiquinone/menaquinone biosynthesis C-methylase UbiE [Bacillus horti]
MESSLYETYLAQLGIGGAHPGGFGFTKQFLEQERLHPHTELLDAGCGTGQTASYIASQYGCKVTVIDHNETMLEKATQRFSRDGLSIHSVQGDVQQLPFEQHSFDFVITESVLIFTSVPQSIKELYRVLKPNGALILLEMTAESPSIGKKLDEFKSFYNIEHIPTEQEWLKLLIDAGFTKSEVRGGESVASALAKATAPSQSIEPMDLNPSKTLHPQLEHIQQKHQLLTMTHAQEIGYRLYRAEKKV